MKTKASFEQFANHVRAELWPHGELELALVERIIGLLWRPHRIGKLEAGVLFWHRCLVANPPEVTHSNYSCRQEIMRRNVEQEEAQRRANAIEHAKKTDAFELAATGEAHIGGENSLENFPATRAPYNATYCGYCMSCKDSRRPQRRTCNGTSNSRH